MTTETLDTRRFRALRQDWASEDLARFFLLTPEDMREVRTCRGASNRFGFALNLLLLRLLYCPLPEVNLTPPRIIQFVAMQLNVHPEALAEYSVRRSQTRDEHLVQIRGYLKLRPYAHEEDDPHLAEYLLDRALQRDDPAVLLEEAEDWLREEGILFPAESTISKIIAQVRPQAESQVFAALTSQLTPTQAQALEDLLQREQGKRGSTFAWLKEPAVKASPASIKALISKLETVRQLQLNTIDVSRLNRNRVRVLAHLGAKYHRDSLLRFSQQKRAALLVCYLQDLQQELLDRLLISFDDLITGIFRRTESAEKTHHATHGKALTRHIHTFRKVTKIVLDPEIPDAQVRPRIYEAVPQAQLQTVHDESGTKARPENGQAFDLLDHHYSFLRAFLPDLLMALTFTGTSAAKPIVAGISALKRMDAEGRRKLPADAPKDFLPAEWREAIDAAKAHTAKHLWELCLAEQMRKHLRSSDLSVPGSRQHKVWTSYLHTPTAWAERKASWFTRLPASESADVYLDLLQERYRTTLKTVLDGWESNDFAEMVTKDGKATLDLSKDEKLLIPATVEPLREALLRVMPHARLADVFIEVDDWVGLRSLFTHLNERESAKTRDPRVDVALFAALLAHGLNLPLSTMAEATEIPYHELTHVSDWYLREETLRRAIVALVDYHHSLPLSAAFGPGTTAMSDGIRFEIGARSLHGQYHARYFGPRRGVTLHDMISDQYSHPYIQIISPHMREAHAALDAILHHETELPIREMMVDTAGFTELMYALYDLQGLKLSPRIRDLSDQRLYPVESVSEYGILRPLFRGQAIQRDLIVRCWDDMHRVSASLKDGTVTAVLLVAKLQALDNKNLIYRGLEEYGRLLKTIDILTFLSDKPYRRRIGRMLNKGEAVHSLTRLVAYGQLGILTDRDLTGQLNRATCLSLLLNVIAVWNTRYMQAALDHLRATGYSVLESDLEHLSPILSGHINLHGSHHFDLQAPKKRRGQLRPLRTTEPLF
ncbi:MAG: Tn3 family transposase [Ktedonobacteraceae bacterium]